jgi:hypothetical protein
VEAILDHPLIEVSLNTTVTPSDVADAEHVFGLGQLINISKESSVRWDIAHWTSLSRRLMAIIKAVQ